MMSSPQHYHLNIKLRIISINESPFVGLCELLKHGQALQLGDPVMLGPLRTRAGVHRVPGEDPGLLSPSPRIAAKVWPGLEWASHPLTSCLLLCACLPPPPHTPEGRACAVVFDCKFIETSAALHHNVQALFEGVVRQIRLRRDSKEANARRQAGTRRRESLGKKAKRFLGRIVARNSRKMAMRAKSKSCHDLSVL